MKELIQLMDHLEDLVASNAVFAVATVIYIDGSAYRRPGARMLINNQGDWWGGISGGCLEGDMLKKAQYSMLNKKMMVVQYDTREDDPFELGIGLGCNGLIEILINPIKEQCIQLLNQLKFHFAQSEPQYLMSRWNIDAHQDFEIKVLKPIDFPHYLHVSESDLLESSHQSVRQISGSTYSFYEYLPVNQRIWIFGNQFDSKSLIDQCQYLGWEIHWVGHPNKMLKQYQEKVFQVYHWDDNMSFLKDDAVVLMTHDFDRDISVLTTNLHEKNIQYLGILGPAKRFEKISKQLNENQVYFKQEHINAPIGLDIGALGPNEISVAIVAEIICLKNNRNPNFLKNRKNPIHSRTKYETN